MRPPSFAVLLFALLSSLFGRPFLCRSHELQQRSSSSPAPLSIAPAGNWEGIDGTWNTYAVRVGTPETVVRLFVSTAGYQTWVIEPNGCSSLSQQDCDSDRGNDFAYNQSSTWKNQGTYELFIEQNLGLDGSTDIGQFGYDVVGLEYDGSGGPTLQNQIVGAIATDDYYYGLFGINPAPTNWSNFSDPSPSYVTSLKDADLIPSVSWAYTGGAQYRFSKVLSSLIVGGYDSSRLIANNLTISFGSDTSRNLLVAIQNITAVGNDLATTKLIPAVFTSSLYAYIDSTVAEFWLPEEVCALFENTFNLTYDSSTSLYLVSDSVHSDLLQTNPNVTFTIGSEPVGGDTVEITLPYAAFDLTASPPYSGLKNQSLYFPLRRAVNDTQYTLGKAFLQEAYLIVDWERQNFSVSQVNWQANYDSSIVTISSINGSTATTGATNTSHTSSSMPLSTPAVVGIAIGVAVVLSLILFATYFYCRRKRSKAKETTLCHEEERTATPASDESHPIKQPVQVFPKAELDANQNPTMGMKDGTFYKPALSKAPGDGTLCSNELAPVEADSHKEIFEMPGDFPKILEADGKQMTEKEAMRKREERYNGIDIYSANHTVGTTESKRPAPVNPEDVREIIDRIGPRLERGLASSSSPSERTFPVSPIDGSSSDGSRTLNTFSALSPINSERQHSVPTPSTERRRFSFEE